VHRSSGEGFAWSRTFSSSQQQQPYPSPRADQFTPRHQLKPLPAAAGTSGWLAGRKSSAVDEDNLDRLVEINATPLVYNRGNPTTKASSAVRRPPNTNSNALASGLSTLYGRAKVLPVTNSVAKPFSTGRNY